MQFGTIQMTAWAVVVLGMFTSGSSSSAQSRDRDVAANLLRSLGSGSEIGVAVRELTSDEASKAALEQLGGVYVQSVRDRSPAARAAIRAGDIIVTVDGERVRGVRHFARLVAESPAGRAVRTELVRDGTRLAVDITPEVTDRFGFLPEIGEELERGLRRLPRDLDLELPPLSRARLGLSLAPLTDQLATYFGVKEGVLVSSVEASSPSAQAGLRAGDVITAIDGRTVRRPIDVFTALRSAAPGADFDVRVTRDKAEMTMKVTVPDRPQPSRQMPV